MTISVCDFSSNLEYCQKDFYQHDPYMVMIFSCLFYLHVTETSVKYLKAIWIYFIFWLQRTNLCEQALLKARKKYLNYICLKAPGIYQDTEDLRIKKTLVRRDMRSDLNIFRHEAGGQLHWVWKGKQTFHWSPPGSGGKKNQFQILRQWRDMANETFRCDNYTPGIVMHQNRPSLRIKTKLQISAILLWIKATLPFGESGYSWVTNIYAFSIQKTRLH